MFSPLEENAYNVASPDLKNVKLVASAAESTAMFFQLIGKRTSCTQKERLSLFSVVSKFEKLVSAVSAAQHNSTLLLLPSVKSKFLAGPYCCFDVHPSSTVVFNYILKL